MNTLWIKYLLLIIIGIFVILSGFISLYNPKNVQASGKLIVILGAGYQRDGTPVPALERRLNKGIDIWNNFNHVLPTNDSMIMISGQENEIIVMENFLQEHNINQNHVIQDIYGSNTLSTILNTKKMIQKYHLSPIFISQAYHLPRIRLYTWYYGISNAQFIAADRLSLPLYQMIPLAFRESIAIMLFPLYEIQRYTTFSTQLINK